MAVKAQSVKLDAPELVRAMENQKLLQSDFGARNTQNLRYDDIFNMNWTFTGELEGIDTVIPTVSPSIRNRILGMRRLLDGTEAIIKASTQDMNFDKDGLERSLLRWITQSAKVTKKRLISDMALSAILYGEIQLGLDNTKSMIDAVPDNRKDRAKAVAEQIPFIANTWHPNEGRYSFDTYGLTIFSRETETVWGQVQSAYGQHLTPDQLLKKPNDACILTRYWDLDFFFVWVDDVPIYMLEHKLKEIPVTVQLVDGSQLYQKIETQRQSVMYAVDKAGYFDQQSTILTLISSIIFAMGVMPMYRHQLPVGDEERKLDLDYSVPGGAVHLLPGETYEPIDNRGLVDPALRELYSKNEQAIEEATIYNSALGAPVESNIAFSTISLLAQQGRLPLSGPQHALGDAISSMFELGVRLLRTSKGSFVNNGIDLQPSTFPKDLQLETLVDIKLPQDKLQLANIAHLLKGDSLADTEWIQTNILNITDTSTMQKNILRDLLIQSLAQVKIQALVAEYQSANQNQTPGTPPPAGGPPNTSMLPTPGGTPGQEAPMGGPGQQGQPEQPGMTNVGQPAGPLQGMPSAMGGVLPSQGQGVIPQGA
jgi:hypothetical protein